MVEEYRLGQIVEKGGRKYVYTEQGLLALRKERPKPIYEDIETIKTLKTGNKTSIELVKTKMKTQKGSSLLITLRKKVETNKGTIIAKSFAIPYEQAVEIFKLN